MTPIMPEFWTVAIRHTFLIRDYYVRELLLQCFASRKIRQIIFYYERTNLMRNFIT